MNERLSLLVERLEDRLSDLRKENLTLKKHDVSQSLQSLFLNRCIILLSSLINLA